MAKNITFYVARNRNVGMKFFITTRRELPTTLRERVTSATRTNY